MISPAVRWTKLTSADLINVLGQITGSGFTTNGEYHAYLLTPTALLRSPMTWTNGEFHCTIEGVPGQNFIIQTSTTLTNWSSLATNQLETTSTHFVDTQATSHNFQFYRAVLLA